jgi:hypothetical protein
MEDPSEENKVSSDVQFSPIVAGCGAGCLWTAIGAAILIAIAVKMSAHLTPDDPGWLAGALFLLGLMANVITGYVTASRAKHAKRLHVIIAGITFMVVSMFAILAHHHESSGAVLLSWILTIPVMLVGASIAIGKDPS